MNKTTCSLAATDGPCGPVDARGWCKKHHARYLRHGDPLALANGGKGSLLAKLRAASKATTDECVMLPAPDGRRPSATLDGVQMYAARAVWILANGDPGEEWVLHTCHSGDEGCINIRHLYLGDHGQNMRDEVEAGRSSRGERNARHKLVPAEVQQIRKLLTKRIPQGAIASQFGVSRTTINAIHTGQTWGWLVADEG